MRNKVKLSLITSGALVLILSFVGILWRGPATEAIPEDSGRAGSIWGADYFPNITLTTHDGRKVRFFDDLIRDRVVAVNFIYTTCPDACPMETARMMDVHRLLDGRVGDDVFFYSITIDPEVDTQEVLAKYVETWGIGEGWTFLTGKEEDITLLRKKLGVYSEFDPGEDRLDHNISLVIGNQSTGRWMKRSPYENPHVLANQLGAWLHNWKLASEKDLDYADAPEIRQISDGEMLFRTRCASCHTIGQGDIDRDRGRIGPDLYKVTEQRDPAWMRRWLAEPDVMLEEGDPLATALLAQFKDVPMPNLRLTPVDVEKLIEYMAQESERIAQYEPPEAQQRVHHGDHHGDHGGHENLTGHGDHAMDHGGHADDHGTHHVGGADDHAMHH